MSLNSHRSPDLKVWTWAALGMKLDVPGESGTGLFMQVFQINNRLMLPLGPRIISDQHAKSTR
jgi:hypothetical protein